MELQFCQLVQFLGWCWKTCHHLQCCLLSNMTFKHLLPTSVFSHLNDQADKLTHSANCSKCFRVWLFFVLIGSDATSDSRTTSTVSLDDWKPKLQYFMYKSFADLRQSQLCSYFPKLFTFSGSNNYLVAITKTNSQYLDHVY